jgi:hypothetical protein
LYIIFLALCTSCSYVGAAPRLANPNAYADAATLVVGLSLPGVRLVTWTILAGMSSKLVFWLQNKKITWRKLPTLPGGDARGYFPNLRNAGIHRSDG